MAAVVDFVEHVDLLALPIFMRLFDLFASLTISNHAQLDRPLLAVAQQALAALARIIRSNSSSLARAAAVGMLRALLCDAPQVMQLASCRQRELLLTTQQVLHSIRTHACVRVYSCSLDVLCTAVRVCC